MSSLPLASPQPPQALPHWGQRLRARWRSSLRLRLLALGLMPLVLVFPALMAVLVVVGGNQADSLLRVNLQSSLAGARNYLDQMRTDTASRVEQLVKSTQLQRLETGPTSETELTEVLRAAAESSGLDYLLVANVQGQVIGSSHGSPRGTHLVESYVIRQARNGVAAAAYERVPGEGMVLYAPQLAERDRDRTPFERQGLVINAAAHFPLSVNSPDLILVGGVVFNQNQTLIDQMREVIFPVGSLPDEAEGITSLHLDGLTVARSRSRLHEQGEVGDHVGPDALASVMGHGELWLGVTRLGQQSIMMGYADLTDGDGQRVGMIGVGFPDASYRQVIWWLLGMIALLMALTMLAISVAFLRTGRELARRLAHVADTLNAVREGRREARAGPPAHPDELGRVTVHLDELLDTLDAQAARQREAQQAIADEALRRRALFEHERDGVVILDGDGRVLEANPKSAEMLGHSLDALRHLRPADWDARMGPMELGTLINMAGTEGLNYETVHRRADGSTYPAEVTLSRAEWGGRAYVLLLQRDISARKLAEAEVERYRETLERLVDERTQELHQRGEQLDAIFALSPDGFVSFDAARCVSFVNLAFLRMTGLARGEVMGQDEDAFSALLASRCEAGAPFPGVARLRAVRRSPDEQAGPDRRRAVFELARPANRVMEVGLRLAQPGSVSQILYFRDITHETAVDRMKSEFLTTAAHELRTPMTSIYGYAELLRMRQYSPERSHELADTIARQSEWMLGIINELLDLARIESRRGTDFVLEQLTLREVLEQSLAGYRPPTGRDMPQVVEQGDALPVQADRNKLHQAMLNVITNAYKYSPDGGPVTLTLCEQTVDGVRRAGLCVQDQGLGMTPEQVARVGERFYRADTSGSIPGTGLGMAIVKEIVELHRGEVEITSQRGVGTCVTLWLPSA